MTDNISRRTVLGSLAGAVGGIGVGSVYGSMDDGDTEASAREFELSEEHVTCAQVSGEPGVGEVNAHVVPRGSHRGQNDFTYFLDRSSLGLDANQPDEVYSHVHVKLDENWSQPTSDHTCKIYWAGCNLSAGSAGQGGNRPSGRNGWSVRIFTRGPDTGGNVALGSYVYHLDQPGRFGSLWEWPDSVAIGTWHQLDAYVKLNSVTNGTANRDGIVRTWLDGTVQTDRTNVRWRTTEKLGFDRLGPGSYWGGSVPSPRYNVVYYDEFGYEVGDSAAERQTSTGR